MTVTLAQLSAAFGAAACLAACGADTVSAPTMTPPPLATATATPTVAATPVPAPPAPPRATPMSTSGPVGQTLTLDPGRLAAGSVVRISGYAPHCTGVTILSTAFPGPQEFAGVPAVTATSTADGHFAATVTIPRTTAAGGHPVTVRACGGNLGVELTLTVTAPA